MADSTKPNPVDALAEQAQALLNKGITLGEAGRAVEALAAYDEVVRRYGDRPEAGIAGQVARALVNKGVTLGQAGRAGEELAAYDEVVRRYADRPETAIAEPVASALLYKGFTLAEAGRAGEELAAYDEVVRRYADRPEAGIAKRVAMALFIKGVTLGDAGRAEEAAAPLCAALAKGSATLRAAAARALTKIGGPAVASLFARAVEENSVYGSNWEAKRIITAIGTAAGPELLRIARNPLKSPHEQVEAMDLLRQIELDPESPSFREALDALIEMFQAERPSLQNAAIHLVAHTGPPAVAPLVAALDHPNRQTRINAALSLHQLVELAEVPDQDYLTALEAAVPKLEALYRQSINQTPREQRNLLPDAADTDPFLGALTAIEKLLARGGQERHAERGEPEPQREPVTPPEEKIKAFVADLLPSLPPGAEDKVQSIIALSRTFTDAFWEQLRPQAEPLLKSLLQDIPADYEGKRNRAIAINALLTAFDLGLLIHDANGHARVCSVVASHGRPSDLTGTLRLRERAATSGSQRTFAIPSSLDQIQIIDTSRQTQDREQEPASTAAPQPAGRR